MQKVNRNAGAAKATNAKKTTDCISVTIFDGDGWPQTVWLDDFHRDEIAFGRSTGNDIVLLSPIVSHEHGRFYKKNGQWVIEDKAMYRADRSTNGLIYNNTRIYTKPLCDGDFIRIDDGIETISEGVLFVFSVRESNNEWHMISLENKEDALIGRDSACDVILPHVSVSKYHARILREGGRYYIIDNNSTNGIVVNNRRISGKCLLHEKDVIVITNSKLIFTSAAVFYCCYKNGISVDTSHVVVTRGRGAKKSVGSNDVSLSIRPGELVAIVGGSGAGKSTILKCMCGYLPPTDGDVYINGVNLYQNFDSLKKLIGYVPQSDIVYDNLTLHDMLLYTARLRLPKDTTEKERECAVERAIRLVELEEKKDSFIRKLSGGQKKRASIAVELLSDPNLLFLDEPASGLDPGTERSLMYSLREMADSGKTVILVTHSTLQLQLCDQVIFMGRGGNLCFCGSCADACKFFGTSDVIDIYTMIAEHSAEWRSRYQESAAPVGIRRIAEGNLSAGNKKRNMQIPVLCKRYMKLLCNDKMRLLLILLMAPGLQLLISVVADGRQFEQYEMTKSLLFALSCATVWCGIFNAIQEICKERSILKREYMTGLSLTAYILSKILVLGVICFIQSGLIVLTFTALVGLPKEGLFMLPILEMLTTTFLTALAATAMGLLASSFFKNADRAMTAAPILLMPQILFSGLIFKLEGASELISWLVVCRWSMEGYGTTANLNQLQLKLQQQGFAVPHEAEKFFEYTTGHMLEAWGILICFAVVCLILARAVLVSVGKEKS